MSLDKSPRRGGFYNVGSIDEPRWVDANGVEVPADEANEAKKAQTNSAKEAEKAAPHPLVAGAVGAGAVVLSQEQFNTLLANQKAPVAAGSGKGKDKE